MRLNFTDKEFKFIEMLAYGRHFLKDIVNPDRDLQTWANTQSQADLLGVMGEYAVSKYLKTPFDTTINLNGDGGEIDMFLGENSIQVKSTKYSTGRLVFNKKEEIKADINIFVYCNIENKFARILGYIKKDNILEVLYEKNLGHGIRFCVDQENLHPISELMEINREFESNFLQD